MSKKEQKESNALTPEEAAADAREAAEEKEDILSGEDEERETDWDDIEPEEDGDDIEELEFFYDPTEEKEEKKKAARAKRRQKRLQKRAEKAEKAEEKKGKAADGKETVDHSGKHCGRSSGDLSWRFGVFYQPFLYQY